MSRGGGTERMTQILADTLSLKSDYRVVVISMAYCENSYFQMSKDVKFFSLNDCSGKFGMLRKFWKLKKLFGFLQADVVINVDVFLSIYTIPLKLFFHKLKIISWEMFNLENDMGLSWSDTLRRFALTYSNRYVCLTKSDSEAFKKKYKRGNIIYIYNPCEEERYDGYDVDSKIIVTAGKFFYTKGFDLALKVAEKVLPKYPLWRWIFYGDGVEFEKLRVKALKSVVSNQIIFAGRSSRIKEDYKKCSFYVMTSRLEGFGLVLLEAKSCNLPTLAFDVPNGPAEIIENGISGYLIPAFDINAMADAIENLIINPGLRIEFSSNAKRNLDLFSIEKFRNKWISTIDYI